MASIQLLRLSHRPTTAIATINHRHKTLIPSTLTLTLPYPLKPQFSPKFLTIHRSNHKPLTLKKTRISASSTTTPAVDRLISAVGYFLPFINGIQYGRFLFARYPPLAVLFQPIIPIFSLLKTVPYATFVAFFALYLGVVRNPSLSQYVRFNAMQALILDVLLGLPLMLHRIYTPGRAGVGYKIMVMGNNALFVFVVFCFVYSFVYSLLGRTPYLPFVADAAGQQL